MGSLAGMQTLPILHLNKRFVSLLVIFGGSGSRIPRPGVTAG